MQLTTVHDTRSDPDSDTGGWQRAAQRAVHPSIRPVGDDVLSAIAAGLAAVTVPWELDHGDEPSGRRYQRVLATPAYDAWVIYWPTGELLDLHDHGGSAGAFSVVSGTLDEATVESGATVVRTFRSRPDLGVRGIASACGGQPRHFGRNQRARVLPAAELDGLLPTRRRRCADRCVEGCGHLG